MIKNFTMKNRLILPVLLLFVIAILWQSTSQNDFIFETFEGFITKDEDIESKFYLQENESGFVIELKFINEDLALLSFDDFGYVIIDGHFNSKENYIIVNGIHDLFDEEGVVMTNK